VRFTSTQIVKVKIDKGDCPPEMFNELLDQIKTNLSDTFSRFSGTFEYRNFQKRNAFFRDMQKG
jgi:hypothetical protein